MFISATEPTIGLNQSEIRAALACRVPLDRVPQVRRAEWLELQFSDAQERDAWIVVLETAFDNSMYTPATLPADHPELSDMADLSLPLPRPRIAPSPFYTGVLWITFWGVLLLAGAMFLLGLLAQ